MSYQGRLTFLAVYCTKYDQICVDGNDSKVIWCIKDRQGVSEGCAAFWYVDSQL